jgi:hypothetical protein
MSSNDDENFTAIIEFILMVGLIDEMLQMAWALSREILAKIVGFVVDFRCRVKYVTVVIQILALSSDSYRL